MKRGNWTDNPCYYVSVRDGQKFAYLAGPFRKHQEALDMVDAATKAAQNYGDPKAWFYAYGTCKAPNGHREGLLNKALNL